MPDITFMGCPVLTGFLKTMLDIEQKGVPFVDGPVLELQELYETAQSERPAYDTVRNRALHGLALGLDLLVDEMVRVGLERHADELRELSAPNKLGLVLERYETYLDTLADITLVTKVEHGLKDQPEQAGVEQITVRDILKVGSGAVRLRNLTHSLSATLFASTGADVLTQAPDLRNVGVVLAQLHDVFNKGIFRELTTTKDLMRPEVEYL